MIAGGHGEANPNTSWLDSRGFWLAYVLGMLFIHLVLLSIPFVNVYFAWTITNVLHNLVSGEINFYVKLKFHKKIHQAHLYFLHGIKGAPWLSTNTSSERRYTHWEQINYGQQFTETRKFLTIAPIVM